MENEKNRKYMTLLEQLELMLKQTTSYQYSPALLKLHLYAVSIQLWHVIQQFDELKANYKVWMLNPDNLDLDTVIDYQNWSKGDRLRLPLQGLYPQMDTNEIKKVRCSLDGVEKTILELFKGETFDVDVQSMSTALCNEIKCSHLGETIKMMLEYLRLSLLEIHDLLSENQFTEEEVKQFCSRFLKHGQFQWSMAVKKEFDKWKEANSIDDDMEQLERHFKGKIRVEMEFLFKSGFFEPRLKDQEEVDTDCFEHELKAWKIDEMKGVENPRLYYFALRECFYPQGGSFEIKEKHLGRYILMHRKEVNEKMRQACYRFIRSLELLAKTKKNIAPQQEPSKEVEEEPTEELMQESTKKLRPGPAVTQIFTDVNNRQKIAAWIQDVCTAHYDNKLKTLIVSESSYNLTDFLLAIYYVLVERKLTISVIGNNINNQYYKFLTEDCRIEGLASQKTFLTHLNKLVKTGKDFYQLTDDIITKNTSTGGYTKEEYKSMKTMAAAVKQLLPKLILR